jgi:Zn-dependent protease
LNCEFCGREESLPFVCNYCGGTFCGDHRLPEAHLCRGDLRQRPVVVNPPGQTAWSGGTYGTTQLGSRSRILFSGVEIRDILIAWVALSAAFVIAQRGGLVAGIGLIGNFGVSLIAVGLGFVLHELMHKFTAERYGYQAEFKMWPFGIVFALITSALGFIFAAPGATYIHGYDVPPRQNGIISLAGPITNIVIATIFLPLAFFGGAIVGQVGVVGLSVNLFLAGFNMLPIMPLDGAKVWRWNKGLWALIEIPLGLTVLALFLNILSF